MAELGRGLLTQKQLSQGNLRILVVPEHFELLLGHIRFQQGGQRMLVRRLCVKLPTQTIPNLNRQASPWTAQVIYRAIDVACDDIDVFSGRFKRLSKQIRCKLGDFRQVIFGTHGCRCRVTVQVAWDRGSLRNAGLEAPKQKGDFGTQRPGVHMGFVNGDVTPAGSKCPGKERRVTRAQQKVLKHRVVCQQYVGRSLAHLVTRDQLVGKTLSVWVLFIPLAQGSIHLLLRVARIAPKRNVRSRKQFAQTFKLVVCQGIHRIENHCAHARLRSRLLYFAQYVIDDGIQKALGFTRARTRCYDVVLAFPSFSCGTNLVRIQLAIGVKALRITTPKREHAVAEYALTHKFAHRFVRLIRRGTFKKGAFCQVTGLCKNGLELSLITFV